MTSDASPFHTVRRTPSLISSHNAARNLLGLPYIPALVIVDRVERRVVTSGCAGFEFEWTRGGSGVGEGRRGISMWGLLMWRAGRVSGRMLGMALLALAPVFDLIGMDVRPLRLRLTSSESAAPTPSSPSPVTEEIPAVNDASAIISMIADTPSHDPLLLLLLPTQ
ncbi:hypothetical protein BC829DRAFT_88504 [Chytridium lagenaria]|nr:hypothetical protein BC829DRAFT_88504 [Chytridium lagenaria]